MANVKIYVKILTAFLFVLFLQSCVSKKDHEELKSQYDSLNFNAAQQESLLNTMDNQMDAIGILLDSIERAEESIMLNLENGIQYDDYAARLGNIQKYMDRTNEQLRQMEKSLSESDSQNKVYQKVIANYKRLIAEKDATIKQMQERLDVAESEKSSLVKTVDMQNEEIIVLQKEIQQKQMEIQNVESDLLSSQAETIKTRAERYFSLAQTTEELAEKTSGLFSGKKKKAHYRQAYEYYKHAFELDADLEEAYAKMEELEEKL